MKAIMIMFDSLNRHMLSPYGCDWVLTPNFERLAKRTVVFSHCYAGSLPCMPARRELHTGRYNFLHRSWGPLEPFDDSMPSMLSKNGVYTHLVTDHKHYWEEGGATYHTQYDSFEFVRGQEGDPWKGEVEDPLFGETRMHRRNRTARQDWVNRKYITKEEDFPQAKTFAAGLEFIRTNARADHWFLQIESFDPHEPFYHPDRFGQMYHLNRDETPIYWPLYKEVDEAPRDVERGRREYAALLSMCDDRLGKVLDAMDELDLWKDTMLIVNTDHGFLLGEHGWWGKSVMPLYEELAHLPLFIWDPRSKIQGEGRHSIVQTIDIPATLLEYFGLPIPADMNGVSLREVITSDRPVRDGALFGIFGRHVNCTDGRYVYMRAPEESHNGPLFNYTLMPTNMRSFFSHDEMMGMELSPPLAFTKNLSVLKVPSRMKVDYGQRATRLYDLGADAGQGNPIENAALESRMKELMMQLMRSNDAPAEQFVRLGLKPLSL